jgi:hypothetical protein
MPLSFIRNSTSLREVFLAGWDAMEYAGYLIDAIADSQHVAIFRMWNHLKHPKEEDLLVVGLYGKQSIKTLRLSGNFDQSAATAFADYMQSRNGIDTSRITSLTLPLFSFSSEEVCYSDRLIGDLLKGPYSSGLQSVELEDFQVPGVWNGCIAPTRRGRRIQQRRTQAIQPTTASNTTTSTSACTRSIDPFAVELLYFIARVDLTVNACCAQLSCKPSTLHPIYR